MGRKFRGGKKGKGRGGGNATGGDRGRQPRSESWQSYPAVKKENERLQRYYNTIIGLSEEEQVPFWDALRRDLPNSFRFCGSKGHALAVKKLLQSRYMPEIEKIEHADGRAVEPPKPLSWYPNELAWWMTTPKNIIRKYPPFAAFQKFLVSETTVGNISRQEVVSMIPPLLMDVRPGMTVLDMCAAPGSKAGQLLEMIHQGEEARVRKVLRAFAKEDGLDLGEETEEERQADLEADPADAGRTTGLLIANDADYKRGHMLVHQLKRLGSPNLLVTNHDATQYPSIKLPSDPATPNKPQYLKFDRILADVPCSGDGTLRKNMNLWKDWQPGSALGLHVTQVRILLRALAMLKVGGRVVYSTCSMNPVENESVVAAAIDRAGGPDKVEILDCSNELQGLVRAPGMRKWQIMDKSGRLWGSQAEVDEYTKNSADGIAPGRIVDTMFPPVEGSVGADIPLERCMRVYAHQQDTGGFFITVLQKKAEVKIRPEDQKIDDATKSNGNTAAATPVAEETKPEENTEEKTEAKTEEAPAATETGKPEEKSEAKATTEADVPEQDAINGAKRPREDDTADGETQETKKPKLDATQEKPKRSNRNIHGQVEEPFKYLDPKHEVIKNIKTFYHVSSRFPEDRFMVRNAAGEPAKAIYYTSALARDILVENEGRGIKVIHGGVKMFMKQDAPSAEICRWRIQSEGMPILQGYVGEQRVVRLTTKETLRRLLIEMFPRIADGEWEKMGEIGARVRDIGMGCCVLRVEPDGSDPAFSERMALPLWKSIHSLNLMLPKEDRTAMLLRIFNDTTPLINNSLQKQRQIDEAARVKAAGEASAAEKENVDTEEANDTEDVIDIEDAPTPEEMDRDEPEPTTTATENS
ncbi:NOL1/NOP2/sun family protein [Colletotrichum higginsianum]|uniref:NOL1/NOP2/sun family protein n=2 Tax=Colletotrichum higginsianum TaxID=80884 RepID=H1W5L6_COLHI|nr:NOL1/NOP2/sun family protein [Colletotrichum higginsianum IMI 349063]OBR12464.1 NOL1/NOP2/sun family protein [Colletotrichum higginsianum IMI 349063]TIC99766.1 Multisite-specific tRNA:(cytosine-C(5))-methyltransferase [Colletotrichum higginsianum]CCF47780.1 NOL1/NOP2/sun family protein [Colletotrichum higginsianum]